MNIAWLDFVKNYEEGKTVVSLDNERILSIPVEWPPRKSIRKLFQRLRDLSLNWCWEGGTTVHYSIKGVPVGEIRRLLSPRKRKREQWNTFLGRRTYGLPHVRESLTIPVEKIFV